MIDLTEQQSTDTGLDLSASIKINAVSPDHLEYKTERYSRALEETPYTPDKIRNLLASPGGEESLRNMAAMQESMDRREAMNAVLKSQEDINIVRAAAEKAAQPVDASTVIEKRYSEKIHAETMSYGDLNLLREAEEGNPKVVDALYEISVQQSMRTEGFRAVLQEAQKRTQETSWGSYAGQFAKSLIPTYSWATQSTPSLGEKLPASLSGTNVEKQYDVLWAMPPEQAIPLAKQIYEEIYASSTIEAQTWAEGLNDYSAGDSQFNNLMGVLDVASLTPLGAARKVLRKGAKGTVKEAVAYPAKLLKRTVEVASEPRATVQNKMAGTGRVLEAADVKAKELLRNAANPSPVMEEAISDLISKSPGLYDPEAFVVPMMNAHKARAVRIADILKKNWVRFIDKQTGGLNVSRLTPEAEDVAISLAEEELRKGILDGDLNLSLSTVQSYRAKDNPLGITYLEAKYVQPDGALFENADDAYNFADKRLRLTEGSYSVTQEGTGFAVNLRKDVDETAGPVRDKLKTLDNSSVEDSVYGFDFGHQLKRFRGARESVSKFQDRQRGNFTHGITRAQALYSDMFSAVKSLSATEQKALSRIMKIGRNTERVPGDLSSRGVFYNTSDELDNVFMQHEKRLPTDGERTAYAVMRQVSDMQHFDNSVSILKQRVRKGYQKFSIDTGAFDGKELDRLPFNAGHEGTVALRTESGLEYLRLTSLLTQEKVKPFLDRGYKIIQLRDSAEGFDAFGAGTHVNFLVTDNFKKGPIQLRDVLEYRPGGRTIYTDKFFGKQAKHGKGINGRVEYRGDTAILSGFTEAKVVEEMRLLDDVRLAVKQGNLADVQAIVNKGLPWNAQALIKKFQSGEFDVNTPFSVTKEGQNTAHNLSRNINGRTLNEEIGDFDDFSNSHWNDEGASVDLNAAERDGPLRTIQKDEDGAQFVEAETLDPLDAQVRSLGELIKSTYFKDYQTSAAESFVAEYSDLLTLPGQPKGLNIEELRRNPVYYLMNGEVLGEGKRASTARVVLNSIKNLLDTSSSVQIALNKYTDKMVGGVYKLGFEKTAEVVNRGNLFKMVDPIQKGRALAYHLKMGLWNPAQIFLQSTTLHNITFISPAHGPSATLASTVMRRLGYFPEDTDFAKLSSSWVAKAVPGWNKEMFSEAWTGLKASGFDMIKGDLSYRNDMLEPKLFQGKLSSILHSSDMLFQGTERFVRLSAWNTAYSEYAAKFPRLVGSMSASDYELILQRAKTLAGDMTRDANAFWQNGNYSVISQFYGFTARMHELMTGRRLSAGERARLVTGNAFLYGAPTALTPALLFVPLREQLKTMLVDEEVESTLPLDLIVDGFLATAFRGMTGEDYDFASRLGAGEIPIIKNMLQTRVGETGVSELIDLLGGASGSILTDAVYSALPIIKHVHSAASEEGSNADALILQDIVNVLKNATTVNSLERMYVAANIHTYLSKNGNVISENYDLADALFQGLTGIPPSEINESYINLNVSKNRDNVEKALSGTARKAIQQYSLMMKLGREEEALAHMAEARGSFIALGWDEERRRKFMTRILGEPDLVTKSKKDLE